MVEKKIESSEGLFWLVIGVVICVLAIRSDLGSLRSPGPGFIAFLAGILIGGMGAVLILMGFREKGVGREEEAPAILALPWRRLGWTIVLLTAYSLLMEPIGYIISTVLVMFGLFFDGQKRNWMGSTFFSISATLVSYLIFEVWLSSQLPRGIFPWW
jgi:putative tricarboxylic transport membrane protein